MLLQNVGGPEETTHVLGRVLEDLWEPFAIGGRSLNASTSIGIALSDPASEEEPNDLLRRADEAMYRAKQCGKAQYEISGG